MCSVVSDAIYSIRSSCIKYFDINPFQLQAGNRTGLKIKHNNPQDIGVDRIASAIAGIELFPNKNLIIIDFGTATTFCVLSKKERISWENHSTWFANIYGNHRTKNGKTKVH